MIEKRDWNEFRATGLLWFINRTLHLFGWAICVDYEDVEKRIIKEVFPARCKFRGFAEKNESEGFVKVTKYLSENINELLKETNE